MISSQNFDASKDLSAQPLSPLIKRRLLGSNAASLSLELTANQEPLALHDDWNELATIDEVTSDDLILDRDLTGLFNNIELSRTLEENALKEITNWEVPSLGLEEGTAVDTLLEGGVSLSISTEVVFVDKGVKDYQQILADINPFSRVFVLSSYEDGIDQIGDILVGLQDVSAVHIISHGSEGRLLLGNSELTNDSLADYTHRLQQWKNSLAEDADLLFYGCNVAGDEAGKAFVDQLGQLTGADVSASDDITGSSALEGDWALEYAVGDIEAATISSQYEGTLLETLSIDELYDAWKNGTLPNLEEIDLSLDSTSFIQGELSISTQDENTLVLEGNGLTGFVGKGIGTSDDQDNVGLTFTDAAAAITFQMNGSKTYEFSGAVALTGLNQVSLQASTATASSSDEGTTVELGNVQFSAGDAVAITATSLTYSANSEKISLSASDIDAFVGVGTQTAADSGDDKGVRVQNVGFSFSAATESGYSYSLEPIENTNIELVNLSPTLESVFYAAGAVGAGAGTASWVLAGGEFGQNFEFSDLDVNLASFGHLSGDISVAIASKDGVLETKIAGDQLNVFLGEGNDPNSDRGVELTDIGFSLDLATDGSYSFDFNKLASSNLIFRNLPSELDDLRNSLESLIANDWDFSAIDGGQRLTFSVEEFGLGDFGQVSGTLNLDIKKDGESFDLGLSGSGVDLFLGHGASTADVTDDAGVSIADTIFQLTVTDSGYSYEINGGNATILGVDGLVLSAGNIQASGDNEGGSLSLTKAAIELGVNARFSGESLDINLQQTTDGLTVELNGSELAAFVGSGADTQIIDDDLGLSIMGVAGSIIVAADSSYTYSVDATAASLSGTGDITLSATDISIAGSSTEHLVDLGDFFLNAGENASISGQALQFTTNDNGIFLGTTGADAFIGSGYGTADAVGVGLSEASLALALFGEADDKPNYGLSVSGEASLLGVSDLSLEGSLSLQINETGDALQQSITLKNGETLELDFEDGNAFPTIAGSASLEVADYGTVSGEFAIAQQLIELGDDITTQWLIGATDVEAVIGEDGTGIDLSDGELGLYIEQQGAEKAAYALTASGTASILGVDDLTASGRVSLSLNQLGEAVDQTISTPNSEITLSYSAEDANIRQIVGELTFGLSDFAKVSGQFSIEQTADSLKVGAHDAKAFLGTDNTGLEVKEIDLGLILYTGPDGGYAVQGSGQAALIGVDDLSLSGSVELAINRSNKAVDETVAMLGDDINVAFNSDATLSQVTGSVLINVDDYVILDGVLHLAKQTTTDNDTTTTDLLLGLTDTSAFIGTNYGSGDALGVELQNTSLGLLLRQKTDAEGLSTQSYALQGKGSATLLGIDELGLSGELSIAINRMGEAVDTTVETTQGSVALSFEDGGELTSVSGAIDLDINGTVQTSGQFGLEKTVTNGETKLLIGLDNARTFIGSDGSGVELSDGRLGLVVLGTDSSMYRTKSVEPSESLAAVEVESGLRRCV